MPTYRGLDVVMKIQTTEMTEVECLTNVTLESSVSLIDTNCIRSEARTRKAGVEDYSINYTFFQDSKSPAQSVLEAGVVFQWEGYFEGDAPGQIYLSGTAIVENVTRTAEVENIVEKAVSAVNNATTGLNRETATPPAFIEVNNPGDLALEGLYYLIAGEPDPASIRYEDGIRNLYGEPPNTWVIAESSTMRYTNDAPFSHLPPKTGWVSVNPDDDPAPTLIY